MGDNLDRWIAVHENIFDLNHDIPPGSSIDIAKLEGGMITTDTCNGARLLSKLLAEEIDLAVKAKKEELGEAAGEDASFKSVVVKIVMDTCVTSSSMVLQRECPLIFQEFWLKIFKTLIGDCEWEQCLTWF